MGLPDRFRLLAIVLTSMLLLGAGPGPRANGQAGVRTFEIQGAAHVSPLVGQRVEGVPGIVTALRSNGFSLQDPDGDGRPETSDAVFVFTRHDPTVTVGDRVLVSGQVLEFRPAGEEANLATTEIADPVVTVVARDQPLPPPILLGPSGRMTPLRLVAEGVGGDVEAVPALRPDLGALDFFESLESMRVQVNDAVAVGRRAGPGELPVLPEGGAGVERRTTRGGILAASPGEAPPRVILADGAVRIPPASLGDRFPGQTTGIVEYAFGGYRVRVDELPPLVLGGIQPERAGAAPPEALSAATFNVENLSARERPQKLARLAETIVERLDGPDLLVLQELQDDSGAADDGVVTGGRSAGALIAAIRTIGGPAYQYREVPPANNQDGGEPGANIRVGFLFRTDRGLAFVERPGGDATMPVSIVADASGPHLTASPGLLAPTDPAWTESRKPLVGELTIGGQRLFVVGCHFASKRGDQPLFGRFQPPIRHSEARRVEQARLVHAFARDLLTADPSAKLLVLGDLNDVPGSPTLDALKGGLLSDLVETLPESEQYTYVFNGQSEAIDHVVVSPGLLAHTSETDIVHGNADLIGAPSDHDPVLARFSLAPRVGP
jgi:uncharacterized protein